MEEPVVRVPVGESASNNPIRPEFQWLAAKPGSPPRYPSPLRYPGAKRKLLPHIAELLDLNNLRPDLFIELFAGGASISLALLWQGRVGSIGLVDADPLVAAFWQTVFGDAQWLVDQVLTVPLSIEKWRELKHSNPGSVRDRALKCLYLNRTSFSGILYEHAGPIGGYLQNGKYGIDCRFNRNNLADRIRQVSSLSDRVSFVLSTDWQLALQHLKAQQASGKIRGKVVYYLDPPFFDHADRLYRHFFKDEDHKRLRDTLLKMQESWILSYDRPDKVKDLYGGFAGGPWCVGGRYTVAGASRRSASEAILTNLPVRPEGVRQQ